MSTTADIRRVKLLRPKAGDLLVFQLGDTEVNWAWMDEIARKLNESFPNVTIAALPLGFDMLHISKATLEKLRLQ